MEQLSSEALYSSEGKKFYNVNKDNGSHSISLIRNIWYFSTNTNLLWNYYFTPLEYVTNTFVSENIILQVSLFVFHVTDNTAA